MTAIELQRRADRLVSQEINACLSSLVTTLARSNGCVFEDSDMAGLVEQAAELCYSLPDYESAACEAGWSVVSHIGAGCRAVKNDAATDEDVTPYCSDASEAWQAACEQDDIEPHELEVYEHWAVSTWLAEKLAAKGEKVDTDFTGLCVWARTTTGQAIAADSVILAIVSETGYASGA